MQEASMQNSKCSILTNGTAPETRQTYIKEGRTVVLQGIDKLDITPTVTNWSKSWCKMVKHQGWDLSLLILQPHRTLRNGSKTSWWVDRRYQESGLHYSQMGLLALQIPWGHWVSMTRVSGVIERIKAWSSSDFMGLCLDLGLGTLLLESFHSLCTALI